MASSKSPWSDSKRRSPAAPAEPKPPAPAPITSVPKPPSLAPISLAPAPVVPAPVVAAPVAPEPIAPPPVVIAPPPIVVAAPPKPIVAPPAISAPPRLPRAPAPPVAKAAPPPKPKKPPRTPLSVQLDRATAPLRKRLGSGWIRTQDVVAPIYERVARPASQVALAGFGALDRLVDAPPKTAPGIRLPAMTLPVLAVLASVAAFIAKLAAFGPVAGDDTAPVYFARRMLEGAVPYEDFPVSRPPGHLWLLSLAARLGLGGWQGAQVLALAGFIVAVICIALAVRPFGKGSASLAVLACTLSYEPLSHATQPTGESFALPFVALALLLVSRARWLPAGLAVAFGISCAFSAALPVGAFVVGALLFDWRGALRLVGGAIAGLAVVAGVAVALYGPHAIIDPVVLGLRDYVRMAPSLRVRAIFVESGFIVALALLAPVLAIAADRLRVAALSLVVGAVLWAITSSPILDREVIAVAWPFVALAFVAAVQGLRDRWRKWKASAAAGPDARFAFGIAMLAGLFAINLSGQPGLTPDPSPGFRRTVPTEATGNLARKLFWQDNWEPGASPWMWTRVLWHDSLRSNALAEIASIVKTQSAPADELFGEGSFTPLLALETGRRISRDLADPALARAPADDVRRYFGMIEAEKPHLLIAPTRRGLLGQEPFAKWWGDRHMVLTNVSDDAAGWVYVSARRPD